MAKGWTATRRARQSAAIRQWRPWTHSTGPRTREGKATVARNAFQGGGIKAQMRELGRALAEIEVGSARVASSQPRMLNKVAHNLR